MKHKNQIILIFILILSLFCSIHFTQARDWTSGVFPGDYFTYEMCGVYSSTNEKTTLTIPQFEKNNTDWTRIEITAIEGSVVHQMYTLQLKNGSKVNFNFQTDLNPNNQDEFKISNKGVPICAGNLNVDDRIPTAELILSETQNKIYLSGPRQTNHASWNTSDDWGDIYFDRETGMLTELLRTHLYINTITNEVVKKTDIIKLTDSNRWQISSQNQTTAQLILPTTHISLISIMAIITIPIFKERQLLIRKLSKK
jgi:hypothetical protein